MDVTIFLNIILYLILVGGILWFTADLYITQERAERAVEEAKKRERNKNTP